MASGRDGQYVAPRMRAQTAIALATAIVAIKAVLIGVAIRGWWRLAAGTRDGPGRQWFPGHTDGLALAVAFAAVSGALWLAVSDTRSWQARRHAKANLVVVQARHAEPSDEFDVMVTNHGDRPIVDVELDDAYLTWHPERQPTVDESTRSAPLLEPGGSSHVFRLSFDALTPQRPGPLVRGQLLGPAGEQSAVPPVLAIVRFTDADGGRWTQSTTGGAKRM